MTVGICAKIAKGKQQMMSNDSVFAFTKFFHRKSKSAFFSPHGV